MDAVTIQAKIYAGRAKAALRLGQDCNQYRPLTASAPLGNQVGTLKAAFNAGDNTYRQPNLPGDAIWYADMDGRQTQPGDYLVRVTDGQAFYIAGQQPMLPIVCVECNRRLLIMRQSAQNGVGVVGYGGMVSANEIAVLGASGALWPASILIGGKSQPGVGLPSSVKNTGWRIMLPSSAPVTILAGDIAQDDLGRRYSIEAAELSDLGWRINAQELHA